jgi:DNA polymerase-3 subunit epsilon
MGTMNPFRIFSPRAAPAGLGKRLAAWKHLPVADLTLPVDSARYVVVDVETSGFHPRKDRLISLGAVEVRAGKLEVGRAFQGILRQDGVHSRDDILVHGIGATRQREGDPPPELLLEFLAFAGSSPLIAFHARFDRAFLRRAVKQRLGVSLANPFLDLAWLLPGLFGQPDARQRGLDDWMQRFGLSELGRHSADADALAAGELLLIALPLAGRRGLANFKELSAFARREEEAARHGPRGIV